MRPKPTLRPLAALWSPTCQSPEESECPLMVTRFRLGLVPRIDTRSASSLASARPYWTFTPVRRESASSMFLSGILPMSSAVTTSTLVAASFFTAIDFSSEARMPVTSIFSRAWAVLAFSAVFFSSSALVAGVSGAVCACEPPAIAIRASHTAATSGLVRVVFMGLLQSLFGFVDQCCPYAAFRCREPRPRRLDIGLQGDRDDRRLDVVLALLEGLARPRFVGPGGEHREPHRAAL